MEHVKNLLRIGLYRATFDSVQSILPKLSSTSVAKVATLRLNNGFEMFLVKAVKVKFMYRGLAVPDSLADASDLSDEGIKPLETSSTFLTERISKLFCLILPNVPGEGAVCVEKAGLYGTLSSMLVLPQLTNAASMETLGSTNDQRSCFKTIWKKTVPAGGSQREEHC